MVAQPHVMRDMRVGENVIVRPHRRHLPVARRAVNGHVFAERVVIAYLRPRQATLPFQVLGLESDAGERKDVIAFPQPRVAINHHVRVKAAGRPQLHVLSDDAIRPYLAAGANLRVRMDNRC